MRAAPIFMLYSFLLRPIIEAQSETLNFLFILREMTYVRYHGCCVADSRHKIRLS